MRSRVAVVFAVLAAVALVGALVHRVQRRKGDYRPRRPGPSRTRTASSRATDRFPARLLIADRGNDRILLVDPHRRILWRFPTARDRRLGRRLVFDDDTFVEPGGKAMISNEEDHQDIVSIDISLSRGDAPLRRRRASGAAGPNQLNWPDDAYVLPDGTMTVADAYNCRILFIRAHRIVRQIGRTGGCAHDPPRTLGSVNGDTPHARRRRARLGDQRLLDRRLHEDGEASLVVPGSRVVPVRPAAAAGRPHPPRRLLAAPAQRSSSTGAARFSGATGRCRAGGS